MADADNRDAGPPLDALDPVFRVDTVEDGAGRIVYRGELRAPPDIALRTVRPVFESRGYDVFLSRRAGGHRLVAVSRDDEEDGGVPWLNLFLFVATVLSTLYVGSQWYYVPGVLEHPGRMLRAWPFTAAIMGVLGIHELGHYVMARYHDVDASLPYFIPVPWPPIIGTAGAVIRMRERMPSRRALFDIGVAGPLAGLIATIVVTAIGLSLPPIAVPERVLTSPTAVEVRLGFPLLFRGVAAVVGEPVAYEAAGITTNPVVFGGWIGMFVTFLNLLPAGQLDGGHITRALFGKRQRTVAAIVPGVLFAIAGYLYYFGNLANPAGVGVWVFWGLITLFVARMGPARPVRDEPIDARRKAVGAFTLLLGALCFTPVPFQIVP